VERCRKAQRAIIPGHHATTSTHCVEDGGLDLSDLASVHRYATQLLPAKLASLSSDDPSIYALVNNAGQWSPSTELTYSKQGNNETDYARLNIATTNGMETHMLVNHIGPVYLTHLLWKLLQAEKGRARVVTVSSAVAVFPVSASRFWYESDSKSWWETHSRFLQHIMAYSRSKRANLMFAAELHHRYSKHNTTTGGNVTVRSIATHPGYTRTALLTHGMRFAAWLGDAMSKNYWGSMSPAEGAMTQVRAVLDETLSSGVYIGPKYLSHGPPVPLGDVHGWTLHHWPFSRETSRELWESSLKALGIEEFGEVVADNMTVRQA
jgi:NAD(P)-dependent dehydrogenase (short-subunit alcohol dehydrogenase family)